MQGHITQERAKKHVLLLIFAVYLCASRIAGKACGLSTPACHLRLGCSAACVMLLPHRPRCFCCRAIRDIISIVGMTLFFFLFFSEVLQHTRYKGSARTAVAEATQRVLSGSSDWEGGRAMRRQKATISNDQDEGESSSLSNNSERETCFTETVSSVSAEPPPSEDTSTTSSDSESAIIADSDTELFDHL